MKPLRCRSCHAIIGQCDDRTLIIGGVIIEQRVYVRCKACQTGRVWRPLVQSACVEVTA